MTYYMSGWIHVVIGALAIAFGGYFTTKGWNQFNSHAEKRSLINAARREWRQNDRYLCLMGKHHANLDVIDTPMLLSTLHHDALQKVLTSHLFDDENSRDARLLKEVSGYLLNLKPVNDSITKLNYVTSGDIDSGRRRKILSGFYSTALLRRFREHHVHLGKTLGKTVCDALQHSESSELLAPDTG